MILAFVDLVIEKDRSRSVEPQWVIVWARVLYCLYVDDLFVERCDQQVPLVLDVVVEIDYFGVEVFEVVVDYHSVVVLFVYSSQVEDDHHQSYFERASEEMYRLH